ncbi:leucine-rich repeat-containing [Lynx pardinus]|uniref:Leucine-rich repeat-containing n=1 Tax=Lynx pardinus TaxID=191816 RepID=A0A485NJY8_LYNPA|nr:leucine-rich repeat-containing [Lynx pardinus]
MDFPFPCTRSVEIGRQDPLSLLDLAAQSLLNDEDSTVHAMKELPVGLFPTLSTAAFNGGTHEACDSNGMGLALPLPPSGIINRSMTQDLLEAVLDRLPTNAPTSVACPSNSRDRVWRSKLKVLDFIHDFEHCSETTPVPFVITHMLEEPEADQLTPSSREQPWHDQEPVEIHTDLFLGCLVEKSHGWLCLHCQTLVINQGQFHSLVEILGMLELEAIQEARLHHRSIFFSQSDLIQFFTQVGQMYNLGNLIMNNIPWDFPADYFSLLSLLGHLQKLHLIFGCLLVYGLQKPLETLVINGCRLTENDITYLSQSIHATHLKELVLHGNNLSQMVPGPLEALLGEVSGTLQHLNLRSCRLKEAQLQALLPALCCCSHLHSLVFYDNIISTSGIMNVLQHLSGLKELKCV